MEWLVVLSLAGFLVAMTLIVRDCVASVRSMEEELSAKSGKAPD